MKLQNKSVNFMERKRETLYYNVQKLLIVPAAD